MGTAAPAVVCGHTHGTRRTRARETPRGPRRASLRRRADRWLPARVRPRSAKMIRVLAARGTPPNALSECLGGRATAWAPPVLSGTRPKNVERARGQRDRSPHPFPRMAGDRLSAPSDCSRREAPVGGLTCASRARLTNGCVAHARDEARPGPPSPQKKAAPAGHVQGIWWRSSYTLPGEVGYTRAGTRELIMPVHWTADDARTDAWAMAAIIGVRPRNTLSRQTCV